MSEPKRPLISGRLQSPLARKVLFLAGLLSAALLLVIPEFLPSLAPYRLQFWAAMVIWALVIGMLILLSIVNSRITDLSRTLRHENTKEVAELQRRLIDLTESQAQASKATRALENELASTSEALKGRIELSDHALSNVEKAVEKLALDVESSRNQLTGRLDTDLSRLQEMMQVGRVADVEHIAITGALLAAAASGEAEVGFIPRGQHGHALLMRELFLDSANDHLLDARAGYHVLEIGTTREKYWPQMSTSRLAAVCRALRLRMLTVDVDPAGVDAVRDLSHQYPEIVDAKTDFGEKFLASWEGELPPYIYIDAYDFDHPDHSEERQDRYVALQGDTISDEACWNMHLACAEEFVKKCPQGGKVVFDDAFFNGTEWSGKGKTAVPFMLENGFQLALQSDSAAVLVRA